MKPFSHFISIALIGGGAAGFVISSRPLVENKDADVPLNVLGINRSPYGEVFAMAMQGPIDTYFHASEDKGHVCKEGENCQHSPIEPAAVKSTGLNDRLRHHIDGMAAGLAERTNPKSASAAHKFYLRRGIEDKLRFAYNLDPAHYGNYNAYHFFLTEPQLGTRPQLTPTAAKLAQDTIDYCLSRKDDPRPALTAAAAAANVIELMFNDRQVHPENPRFSTSQMRAMLDVSDEAIAGFSAICGEWTERGLWGNLSAMRILELDERSRFVFKVRESQGQAIARLEMTPFDYGVENPWNTLRSNGDPQSDPFGYGVDPSVKTRPQGNNGSQAASGSPNNTASLSE